MLANFGFKALHGWALCLVLAAASVVGPVISAPVDIDRSTRYEWVGWQFIGGLSSGPVLEIGDEVKIRFIGEGGRSGKILSFPIDSERQRNHWITALPSRVERADIGIRMGSVSSQGAFVDLPKNASLYYYAISPGTFSSVITEIHHVGGDFTVLPTLASPGPARYPAVRGACTDCSQQRVEHPRRGFRRGQGRDAQCPGIRCAFPAVDSPSDGDGRRLLRTFLSIQATDRAEGAAEGRREYL